MTRAVAYSASAAYRYYINVPLVSDGHTLLHSYTKHRPLTRFATIGRGIENIWIKRYEIFIEILWPMAWSVKVVRKLRGAVKGFELYVGVNIKCYKKVFSATVGETIWNAWIKLFEVWHRYYNYSKSKSKLFSGRHFWTSKS